MSQVITCSKLLRLSIDPLASVHNISNNNVIHTDHELNNLIITILAHMHAWTLLTLNFVDGHDTVL